jgi:hypothetical protein
MRQNTALLDVVGAGGCILVAGNYSSSLPLEKQCPALGDLEFQEFLKLPKQDFDPAPLEPGEEPIYLNLFCTTHNLESGSLDPVLLCIADWKIVNFFVVSYVQRRIFAPYDTGASVNVLPYELGLQLGLIWEDETLSVLLAGNLARFEARAVVMNAQISSFPTVDLAFAWTQAPNVPLILGQANFFLEFDVVFSVRVRNLKFVPNRFDRLVAIGEVQPNNPVAHRPK